MAARGRGQPDLLTVRLQGDSRVRVVQVDGEVDLSTAPSLNDALALALADRPESLFVDLRKVTFMDSTGLRSLIMTREECGAIDCRLLLMRGSRPVERLIEVSGLSDFFVFVSDPLEIAGHK
jgi:anti-anti-sigma factor